MGPSTVSSDTDDEVLNRQLEELSLLKHALLPGEQLTFVVPPSTSRAAALWTHALDEFTMDPEEAVRSLLLSVREVKGPAPRSSMEHPSYVAASLGDSAVADDFRSEYASGATGVWGRPTFFSQFSLVSFAFMAPLADFLLQHVPLPHLPYYLNHWVPGASPLSNQSAVVGTLVGYLVTIFSIREIIKSRQAKRLQYLFQLHNLLLTSGSALLLVLMAEEILPILWKNGLFYAMCNEGAWTERLEFYYMINYYIKFVELIDTVFLALKKKPLAFLHVFHHSATAFLCFTQLNGKTSVSWVVITLNLSVHVLMYYYYFATAGGAKIWWKKYLTSMQIIQFIIDLFVVYFGTYSYFAATYWPSMPVMGSCAGTESAALFGCGLLTSYLFLFINFYIQTYRKPSTRSKKPLANGNGVANGNGNGAAHKQD